MRNPAMAQDCDIGLAGYGFSMAFGGGFVPP